MPITEQDLKTIIRQEIERTLTDMGMIMPYPLEHEPAQGEEPPELILGQLNEGVDLSRVIKILNALDDRMRERIFRHFRRYSMDTLIITMDKISKASKGSLKPSK
jgi:hypothetical protein